MWISKKGYATLKQSNNFLREGLKNKQIELIKFKHAIFNRDNKIEELEKQIKIMEGHVEDYDKSLQK